MDENLLHEGVARYYGVGQWANLAPGWAGVSWARASQRHDTAHGVGNAAESVRVLRFGVDLMAIANSQGLDESRRYRRLVAHAVQFSANGRNAREPRLDPGFTRGLRSNAKLRIRHAQVGEFRQQVVMRCETIRSDLPVR